MSNYTFKTTKAQEGTIKYLKLENDLTFRPGNVIGAIAFGGYGVVVYEIHPNGGYIKEMHGLNDEGWK